MTTENNSTAQLLDDSFDLSLVHARAQARQLVLTSYERSALSLDDYARLVIGYSECKDEHNRRAAVARRRMLLRDAWGPLLKAKIQAVAAGEMVTRLIGVNKDNLDLSRNPAKRIWKEQAILYKFPPRRYTRDGDEDGAKYRKLLKRTKFNLFWKAVEEELQACNEVLVWPDAVDYEGEKIIRHRYVTGDRCTIVTTDEDPGLIECVVIHDDWADVSGHKHRQRTLWTKNWHATYEIEGGSIERAGRVTTDENPYGMIPHTLVRLFDWQDGIFDVTSGEDLVDATLQGGAARCYFRYNQRMSGFKSLVGMGNFDKPERSILDAGTLMTLQGDGVSLQHLDWQLKLADQLDVMDRDEMAAAASRGINPELYKHTANYQGKRGAQLAERPLKELRAKMVPIMDAAEASYYAVACKVWDALGVEDVPDPEAEFVVEYAPMAYPEDPKEQIDVDAAELGLGLTNHVKLLQRRNPELSDEEAKADLDENWEVIAEVQKIKTSHNVANDPVTESQSAEDNGRMGPAVRDGKPMPEPPGSQPGDFNSEKDQA